MLTACASDGARAAPRPYLEVADIVRLHGAALARARPLSAQEHAVLGAIVRCRTAVLGGHLDVCLTCGDSEPSYNSCRNRHCPKCQALAQARWVAAREERLLPIPYFHVVFTLPAELRGVARRNRRLVFDLLFDAASATLLELGADPKRLGGLCGVTAVLHTWARDLTFHPHLHCIVTGGGYSAVREAWLPGRPKYLFPVKVMGSLFRGKMLAALRAAHDRAELELPSKGALRDPLGFRRLTDVLYRKDWVVYAKRPFGGPAQVVRYLGRYTHRVGISNSRLVSLDERGITFRTKSGKALSLDPVTFLGRFVDHVLPPRFVKIRHYGLVAPAHVATSLAAARAALSRSRDHRAPEANSGALPDAQDTTNAARSSWEPTVDWQVLLRALTGADLRVCRACGARARVRRPLTAARSPPAEPV